MTGTGMVHIYYGDGKGKTTAAVGLAVRAAGCGLRVLVFQFMKNNTSGERHILESVSGITCLPGREKEKFSFRMSEEEKMESRAYYGRRMAEIKQRAGEYQMLVLDEVLTAVKSGFVEKEKLLSFLKEKPDFLEVILTGHQRDNEIFECADYVTEMKKIKHPFDHGQQARKGIEG